METNDYQGELIEYFHSTCIYNEEYNIATTNYYYYCMQNTQDKNHTKFKAACTLWAKLVKTFWYRNCVKTKE